MTRALYHDPEHPLSQLLQFTATVTEVAGTQAALDATAFYPEGGGQSADVGVWRWEGGEARVLGTRKDRVSGEIGRAHV